MECTVPNLALLLGGEAVEFIASDAASFITGQAISLTGGMDWPL